MTLRGELAPNSEGPRAYQRTIENRKKIRTDASTGGQKLINTYTHRQFAELMPLGTLDHPATAEHPLIGAVLRKTYRIARVLDQGGMGTVFEADHVRLHRRLAVKVLAPHLLSDGRALERFNREAEIISQLVHRNIVQILDFDTTESGEPYIVMELLRGESLAARMDRERRLPLPETARIVYQVASGLAAAHHASVVHRDLKPANIFLAEVPAEGVVVKLLDFGISKRAGAGRRLTGEFDILGTPDYMTPEQALGKTALVDHRGDQYSLAVIAYEALCGQTPFSGNDVMDVLRQVIGSNPLPLEHFDPGLPASVWNVLKRALEKQPDQRFPDVLEFASAFLSAAGCSVPPAMEGLRALDQGSLPASTAPPESFVGQRADGRYRGSEEPEATANRTPAPAAGDELTHLVNRAREAFGLGDVELAVSFVERALAYADSLGSAGADRILAASSFMESVLQTSIGSVKGPLVVRRLPSTLGDLISPAQAFLLSRLEGQSSVEEVIDLSPLPRRETLRQLVAMLRTGVLGVE